MAANIAKSRQLPNSTISIMLTCGLLAVQTSSHDMKRVASMTAQTMRHHPRMGTLRLSGCQFQIRTRNDKQRQ